MLLVPGADPARSTYVVAGQPVDAVQLNVTMLPASCAVRPVGASGWVEHGAPPAGTVASTTFDGGLSPNSLIPVTVTKYRPSGAVVVKLVCDPSTGIDAAAAAGGDVR